MQRISPGTRSLCVSIHDVSSHTWKECQVLIRAVRAVAGIPITLLVVPAYHRLPPIDSSRFESALENHLADGDELALHGYTHLDEGRDPSTWYGALLRQAYARQEGEFASLEYHEAARRIELGLEWFAQRKWPVHGFVAPAWLLSDDALSALSRFPFRYTTTTRDFCLLPDGLKLRARPMVYGARNAATRWLSMRSIDLLEAIQSEAPLVRLGLHPADVRHPQLIEHSQRLLKDIMATRHGMTKIAFAGQLFQSCKHGSGVQFSAA